MSKSIPADPFEGICQLCGKAISKGENYYTVVVNGKDTHICQECHDKMVDDGIIDPKEPAPFSPNK